MFTRMRNKILFLQKKLFRFKPHHRYKKTHIEVAKVSQALVILFTTRLFSTIEIASPSLAQAWPKPSLETQRNTRNSNFRQKTFLPKMLARLGLIGKQLLGPFWIILEKLFHGLEQCSKLILRRI